MKSDGLRKWQRAFHAVAVEMATQAGRNASQVKRTVAAMQHGNFRWSMTSVAIEVTRRDLLSGGL